MKKFRKTRKGNRRAVHMGSGVELNNKYNHTVKLYYANKWDEMQYIIQRKDN